MISELSPRTAALAYAEQGWPVLPLHAPLSYGRCSCGHVDCAHIGKHPRHHRRDLSDGLYSATTSAGLIERWWQRWPDANVGVRTGAESGLVVIDVDGPGELLGEPTARVLTSRGTHSYHKYPPPPTTVGNYVGLLPQVDVRGKDGYVVAPPSRHVSGWIYCWQEWRSLAPMPHWTLDYVTALQQIVDGRTSGTPRGHKGPQYPYAPLRYAQATFTRECQALQNAIVGTRNNTLNWIAYRSGQFIGAGWLDDREVTYQLTRIALQIGLTRRETAATLASGLSAGIRDCPWQ